MKKNIIALIVAGGRGTRLNATLPKQYIPIAGIPCIRRATEVFIEHPDIDKVAVVIAKEDTQRYHEAIDGLPLLPHCYGGATRQASVYAGLKHISAYTPDYVLIHDAARPMLSKELLSNLLSPLSEHRAVIPTLAIADTLKQVANGTKTTTIDRRSLYLAQTPQAFDFATIFRAHETHKDAEMTDDASLLEASNITIYPILGESRNFKITTEEDLAHAEALLEKNTIKTSFGSDIHRLEETNNKKNSIMLGGIAIPHNKAIIAHSDGDVVIHAIVDALLGTYALGDIGTHFPPTDPQWQDAASHLFLEHAHRLITERGGSINHIDVTILAEKPKLRPFIDPMRSKLASLLALPIDAISIKATTTEQLGFIGREEGIQAQAIVTILHRERN